MTATNVNDMFANEDRYAAPVLTGLSNRTVAAGGTLAFAVNYTKDPSDTVELACASTLAPGTWSFTAPKTTSPLAPLRTSWACTRSSSPPPGATAFDEELITITVLPQQSTPYEDWAGAYAASGFDPDGPDGGLTDDDFDHDGYTNEQEYWADTDPTDDASYLQLGACRFPAPTQPGARQGFRRSARSSSTPPASWSAAAGIGPCSAPTAAPTASCPSATPPTRCCSSGSASPPSKPPRGRLDAEGRAHPRPSFVGGFS
jgi:hypothetical protein